jgi:hypothetical protein
LRKSSLFTLRQAQGERGNDDNQGVFPVRGEPVEPQTKFFRKLLEAKNARTVDESHDGDGVLVHAINNQ